MLDIRSRLKFLPTCNELLAADSNCRKRDAILIFLLHFGKQIRWCLTSLFALRLVRYPFS